MPCEEFERRLTEYATLDAAERAGVDAHVSHCPECREWLRLLAEIDAGLQSAYGDVRAPVTLAQGLGREARPRLSPLPELLDWIAWTGVAVAAAAIVWFSNLPPFELTGPVLYATAGIFLLFAASVSVWATRDSAQ